MELGDKYQTGVLWQDFQHGQLIDLFDKIQKARENRTDENLYRYTLAFLAMYVTHHFKLEEQYMEAYNYPDAEVHKKEHQAFVAELKLFRNQQNEYSDEGAEDLLTRVGEWILSHILDVDQDLGKFILEYEKNHSPLNR